jgi:hypothetical protein
MTQENPFAELADHTIVGNARISGAAQGAYGVEMMRRLKGVLEGEMQAANELSGKIHRLNQSLLGYTVAMALMAAFQLGILLWEIVNR